MVQLYKNLCRIAVRFWLLRTDIPLTSQGYFSWFLWSMKHLSVEDIGMSALSSILWETLILNQLSSSSITGCLRPLLKEHDWVLQVKKEVQESLQSISQVHILNGPLSLHSPVFLSSILSAFSSVVYSTLCAYIVSTTGPLNMPFQLPRMLFHASSPT